MEAAPVGTVSTTEATTRTSFTSFTSSTARAAEARRTACLRAQVKLLTDPGDLLDFELVPATRLRIGDHVLCTPGDMVAFDGTLVAGAALVDVPGAAAACEARGAPGTLVAGALVRAGHLVARVDVAPG